jgi:hypothetical protein
MKKIAIYLTFTLCAITQLLSAQIIHIERVTEKPLLYGKTEFNVQLKADWQNPYLQEDIALDLLLSSPSGKKLTLPCYYESGSSGTVSLWKARFAPREKGLYTYVFELKKKGILISSSQQAHFISYPSGMNGFLHSKSNWVLQFDSGKPFRGLGEDIAWESRASDDSKFFKTLHENPKYNYEYMLRSLAKHGGNFFRTWISSFNLPIDWQRGFNSNRYQPSDKYFNPSAIAKMDRLTELCDSLHIFMMLTLGEGAASIRAGGFSPTSSDFFVNPKSKQRYKDRLRYFIARWGYSPSIAAWELFNEVDNVQFGNKNKPISADSIVQWHDEMSTYIKQTDPYGHLVTTSISHRDLKGLNSLANIDINQKHIYKNTASIPGTIIRYEKNFGKPYVIGEYGYEWDWSKNFDDFAGEMDSDYKRGLWYGLFSPTPILPMSWWWEYFDNRKTDTYMLRVRPILDMMLTAGRGSFDTLKISASDSVNTYGVICGKTSFVYAFNASAKDKHINFDVQVAPHSYAVIEYDCESGRYQKLKSIRSGSDGLQIDDSRLAAKTDVIYILTEISK